MSLLDRPRGHSAAGMKQVLAGAPLYVEQVRSLLSAVESKTPQTGLRLINILQLLYEHPAGISAPIREQFKQAILNFRYWMDEPGNHELCMWSENRQILFSVCEYLAGQLFPDQKFGNSGFTGRQRQRRANLRLSRWLDQRFRFGFSEWCSPVFYEVCVSSLALFISFSQDSELRKRAVIVLDLLLLDMAMHRFDRWFVGASSRSFEAQKKNPASSEVNEILAHAFSDIEVDPPLESISAAFIFGHNYQIPEAIKQIANSGGAYIVRQSSGLDLCEIKDHFPDFDDVETTGAYLWGMEAFTNIETIEITAKAFQHWRLYRNRYLTPLKPFMALRRLPFASRVRLLQQVVRLLNPATQGVAIQRGNIYAYRTPEFHLSAAVHHQPGTFGDQQHVWQATLPRCITVFATHPASPMFDDELRNTSPSYWVGNGRMPDVGQHENVLVALYDISGRRGYLESSRPALSHLYFPFVQFDETKLGQNWVTGRVGDSFIGVRGLRPLEMVGPDELQQRGEITGYGVMCAGGLDFSSLQDFTATFKETTLSYRRNRLHFGTQQGRYEIRWKQGLWGNGRQMSHDFDRFDTPWVRAKRFDEQLTINCHGHKLILDWPAALREES